MPKLKPDIQDEVEKAFETYQREVETSRLAKSAKQTYLLHSWNFVRWLRDDFEPGARLKGRGR